MQRNYIIVIILLSLSFYGCEKSLEEQIVIDTPDWTDATHGNSVDPDYDKVFPEDAVQRLDIVISSEDWAAIQEDLAGMPHSAPGNNLDGTFEPIWVPCDFFYGNKQWYKTGIRVKGNSSLRSTISAGIKKYSFKLDFDQYEDTYPGILNQRFYGFKQLNLNNNFEDQSFMREKVAGDLFREFGIPCAKSAYYEVYINYGNGSQYFGLYTMVEEVDDTVISTQFAVNDGNLYKPEGTAASFGSGTYNTADFYNKTNEESSDWSDIKALYDALHSGTRISDPATWRVLLESEIDMDLFIKWLAANTVMQNWDSYGRMPHNYYLYNDPDLKRFIWIPWDNNEALQTGKQGGAINLDRGGVSDQWPLISYVASDLLYYSLYKQYARSFTSTVFESSKVQVTYDYYYDLIRESVEKEEAGYTFLRNGISGFDAALLQLKQHVSQRCSLVLSL
ncbi:MAG: CotH kinase family protein [Bacteroidales bacterium]|nr:CotH kinase family protein [Bacteroidales bacterium]